MKLKAINPIEHNGKRYDAQSKPFDVADEDQAQALIDCGAAEEVQGETAAEKKAREKAEAEAAAADKAGKK